MCRVSLFVLALFFCGSIYADTEVTNCKGNEDIYFSCPLANGKTVSICAKNNTDPTKGYVQYRYGRPDAIELEYPSGKIAPKGIFYVVNADEGSAHLSSLKFKVGRYLYRVNQAFSSFLTVTNKDRLVLNQSCEAGDYAGISDGAWKGIPEVEKTAEDVR
jgi:hypothetical protein